MMRTLIVTAALAALVTTATAASATARNPKPGDYAQSSKVYAEYIANCRVERNTRPDLRDEAARKLEKLSRAQIELQIEGCQMSLPKPAAQRQAANVPPAAYVGAGVAAGVVLARSLRRGGHQHEQGRLSEVELKNLEGLAQKALGPVRAEARLSAGDAPRGPLNALVGKFRSARSLRSLRAGHFFFNFRTLGLSS